MPRVPGSMPFRDWALSTCARHSTEASALGSRTRRRTRTILNELAVFTGSERFPLTPRLPYETIVP